MSQAKSFRELDKLANTIRQDIITSLVAAGSGHSAGPLGMTDVFSTLYGRVLNHRPKEPRWPGRDRVVLSNAHINPVLYATLANVGYFPKKELLTLRKLGTRLQGHSTPNHGLPGVETSGGPLGQGLSQAVGMALARQLDKAKHWVYCLMSDGELDEGQSWEAILFAAKRQLYWLTAIIDRNNIQIDGNTEEIMPLEPLADKFRAFNWHVQEVDGHNVEQIIDACNLAKAMVEKPSVIIAHTIPGKGVDFMEYDYRWHGKPPKPEEAREALRQLRTLGGRITNYEL